MVGRITSFGRSKPSFKDGADNRLLPPDLTLGQFAVGGQAGKLGAGSRAAGRAVVLAARAEHEIARVGDAWIARRTDQFDVIDRRAVVAGDRLVLRAPAECVL